MRRVVILSDNGFQDHEVIYPFYRLQEAGFEVDLATEGKKTVYGKSGVPMHATCSFDELAPDDFEAVIIPGGYESPDRLRMDKKVLAFVASMDQKKKLVASMCHGLWVAISAKIVSGKRATCYPSLADDLMNAGATYLDEPVVVDRNLISSRHYRDLPDFLREIIRYLG